MKKRVLIVLLSFMLVFSLIPSAMAADVPQETPASSEEPIVSEEPSPVPEPTDEPTTVPSEEPVETPQPTPVPTEEPAEEPQPATVPSEEQPISGTALMYTIAATPNDTDYGTVTGGGRYISGAAVTITATPKPGYRFIAWQRGTSVVTINATYSFSANNNYSFIAWFAAIEKPVLFSAVPLTYNTVALSWSAVEAAAGYEVLRAKSSSGTYTGIGITSGTSYTDTVPQCGRTYYYKVRAYCTTSTGITTFGSKSSYKSVKPDWEKLYLTAATENYYSVRLTWNPVSNADHYDVYRNTKYYGTYEKIADNVAGTSYIDDKDGAGLTTDKRYYYKIKPVDVVSPGVEVTGPFCSYKSAKPAWPKIYLTARTQNYYSIFLNWNAINGANHYHVYRNTKYYGTYTKIPVDITGTTYLDADAGLELNKTYYYKIKPATSGEVEGPFCSYKSAKPAWPNINLTASAKDLHKIELSWNEIDGANYYDIYRKSGSGYDKISTVGEGTQPKAVYVDNGSDIPGGLETGKRYYYYVQPFYDYAGDEAYGPKFYDSAKPGWATINLKAESYDYRRIKLEWNKVDGANCYYVFRSTHYGYGYKKIENVDPTADPTVTYIDNNNGAYLTMGKKYYYMIKPVNHDPITLEPFAIGPYCAPKSARPVPAAPYDLSITHPSDPNSLFVSWEWSPGATGYELYRSYSESGTYVRIRKTIRMDDMNFTDTGLTLGQTYYYKVRAYYYIGSTKYYTAYDTASETV